MFGKPLTGIGFIIPVGQLDPKIAEVVGVVLLVVVICVVALFIVGAISTVGTHGQAKREFRRTLKRLDESIAGTALCNCQIRSVSQYEESESRDAATISCINCGWFGPASANPELSAAIIEFAVAKQRLAIFLS